MSGIRPLARDDLPGAAALFQRVMRGLGGPARPELLAELERTLFGHPWVDPEIPSLVYEEDGRIVGFIGSHVARMRFDGRPVRMACCARLVADPGARNRAAGAMLLSRYKAGPQDLTIGDTAEPVVRRMWEAFRGETIHLTCITWARVFRPFSYALLDLPAASGRRERVSRPVATVLDRAAAPLAARVLRPEAAPVETDRLTPQAVIEHVPTLAPAARLLPDYDLPYLEWLFGELEALRSHGTLVARLVRRGGRVLGWYLYFLRPGGRSRVLQVAAPDKHVEAVAADLFRHAYDHGAAVLSGRVEPRLLEVVATGRSLLRVGERTIADSRHPEILDAVRAGRALLTRLEGEWWWGEGR